MVNRVKNSFEVVKTIIPFAGNMQAEVYFAIGEVEHLSDWVLGIGD